MFPWQNEEPLIIQWTIKEPLKNLFFFSSENVDINRENTSYTESLRVLARGTTKDPFKGLRFKLKGLRFNI